MSNIEQLSELDDLPDLGYAQRIRNVSERELHAIRRMGKSKRTERMRQVYVAQKAAMLEQQIAAQVDSQEVFNFTYQASRHERGWIVDSLGGFYEQRWLDDVLRLVKGGKEANVYLCQANESVKGLDLPYLAAKVYRPRRFRNLKNDQLYREGRVNLDEDGNEINDDRMQRAMQKKTEYGRELLHTSWIEHEVKTMQILQEAGADVPRVFASGNNAILMSYIGDKDLAAPVLHSVRLNIKEGRRHFERVLYNIELMLAHQCIHGDLSAFNILYWQGEITLIDFPQAIDPFINRNAFRIFERDIMRVCEYFVRQGVKSNPRRMANDIWKAHHLREIPDVHPALLDANNKQDRSYWQRWLEKDGYESDRDRPAVQLLDDQRMAG
jgi:RIO kinase 1